MKTWLAHFLCRFIQKPVFTLLFSGRISWSVFLVELISHSFFLFLSPPPSTTTIFVCVCVFGWMGCFVKWLSWTVAHFSLRVLGIAMLFAIGTLRLGWNCIRMHKSNIWGLKRCIYSHQKLKWRNLTTFHTRFFYFAVNICVLQTSPNSAWTSKTQQGHGHKKMVFHFVCESNINRTTEEMITCILSCAILWAWYTDSVEAEPHLQVL